MRNVERRIRTLLAQQSGQIQVLIIAPILTLFLLSLVVRTASSAIDPALEKKKITQQLKQRLSEVRSADGVTSVLEAHVNVSSSGTDEEKPKTTTDDPTETLVTRGSPTLIWRSIEEDSAWQQILVSTRRAPSRHEGKERNRIASVVDRMQWEIVKGEEQGQILFAPGVTTQPSDKKKKETERKLIAGRVHDFDEVKKSIENQSRKQPTPPIEQLAALTPVNLPKQPTLATQEEEPILPLPEHARHKIKRKETLGKILQQIGVPAAETAQWVSIAKKVKEFRSLRPGEVLELSFTEDVEDRELQVITYQLGKDVRLVLEKHKDGSLEAKKIQPVAQPVFVVLGGSISKHLSSSVKKAGIPARFVTEMTKLDWDIDLGELRKGDSFKILLEAVQRGEEIVEYKRLLAAEVMNHGEVFTVFSIPEEKRRSRKEYLAEEYKGKGMQIQSGGQKFLPFPLEFSRMSSVFTESRFHPILRRSRPHNGVDLAAPYGTPVHAVASGRVTFIGRQSGYGNIVKIDHPGPYETGYAHLQQFAEGLTEGEKVEKGQLIGYVGSTGLATGPHLHFELLKEGVFVNPLAEKTSDGEPVKVANAVKEQKVDPMIEKKKQRFRDQLATLDVKKGIFVRQVLPQGTSTSVTASIEVEQLFSSRSRSAAASRRVRR